MSKDLRDALRSLVKPNNDGFAKVCTVDSVDLVNLICYCIPLNGDADLVGVRLMANIDNGFLLIPEVDSIVVVSFLSDSSAYVSLVSKVSEVNLNGKNFDGLVKINEQTAKLNQLVNELQAQLILIASGITAGGGSYSPGTLSQFNKTDYENITTLQGDGS
jgi:hypothetical protein